VGPPPPGWEDNNVSDKWGLIQEGRYLLVGSLVMDIRFGELKVYKANTGAYPWLFVISQHSINGELDHSEFRLYLHRAFLGRSILHS